MIISLQASTPIFMDSGLSSFCLINVSMGGGKFCRVGPKNISLTSLSIEPSPWGKNKQQKKRLMKELMIHTKKGVRERTPEERAFLKEEEPPPCTFAVNSDSSKRNCSDLHIMATTHQSLHIPFLWYLSATRRDAIISFPWRVLHMARWAQVKGKLLVESARVWFCNVYEVRSCTAPIILQLSALLRNTRDLPHDFFLDTLSPHKMSLFLYLSKRFQLVQPVRK